MDPNDSADVSAAYEQLRARVVLCGLFVVLLIAYVLPPVRTVTDSGMMIPTAYALVENHNVVLDAVLSPERQARNDYRWQVHDGHKVSTYPVGPALMAVPFVQVAEWAGMDIRGRVASAGGNGTDRFEQLIAAVISAAAVALFAAGVRRRTGSLRPAVACAALLGLATSLWSTTSRSLGQHAPLALLVVAAWWVALSADGRWRRAAVVGGLLGAALWCRPSAVLVGIVFLGWAWRLGRRHLAAYAVGFAVPLVALSWFNAHLYSDPNPLRYPLGADLSPGSLVRGATANLFSPSRGMLVFTPLLLIAPVAAWCAWRRRMLTPLDVAVMVAGSAMVMVAAVNPIYWAGHSYGPRLTVDAVPLLAMTGALLLVPGVAPSLAERAMRWGRVALVGMVAWSVFTQFVGVRYWSAWLWNVDPVNVDLEPCRTWDWSDPQFLRIDATPSWPTAAESATPTGRCD